MPTLVSADRLFDGHMNAAVAGAGVLVQDGKIIDVGAASDLRARASEHIELPGTLLPGLCDMHTHVCLSGSANPVADLQQESHTATVLRAVDNLRRHLAAGVTTIRDLGGKDTIDIELRNAVNAGLVRGPRMFVAGRVICMTGGHACWIGMECDSVDDARGAARQNLKSGADHLKVIATGGVMTQGVEPGAPQLDEAEIRAVCREADKVGRHVAAHAQGTVGIQNALKGGVRTIEHGFYIDGHTVELFLETGAVLVPTFAAAKGIVEGGPHGVPDYMVAKMEVVGTAHQQSFQRCQASRVPMVAGTDAGTPLNPHGNIAVELEEMVAHGASPVEALRAATSNAALVLGRADLGSLTVGMRADLLVVDGDPLAHISDIRKVTRVWKDGKVVARAKHSEEHS